MPMRMPLVWGSQWGNQSVVTDAIALWLFAVDGQSGGCVVPGHAGWAEVEVRAAALHFQGKRFVQAAAAGQYANELLLPGLAVGHWSGARGITIGYHVDTARL